MKLTAQFVARNGRQFLTQLMQKEQRNYQFDFLRPQHSLFNYFTKLVEQYTKILIPPKGLFTKLKKEAENPREVLDQVCYRVEWAKFQERERKKEEEEKEKERVAYAQIDWHDFVVVETVDFQPNEQGNFPRPPPRRSWGPGSLFRSATRSLGRARRSRWRLSPMRRTRNRRRRRSLRPSWTRTLKYKTWTRVRMMKKKGRKCRHPRRHPCHLLCPQLQTRLLSGRTMTQKLQASASSPRSR